MDASQPHLYAFPDGPTGRVAVTADVERYRGEWERLRALCQRHTPNADPDRFSITTERLCPGSSPWIAACLRPDGTARWLLVGRLAVERVKFTVAKKDLPLPVRCRALNIVHGGVMLDPTEDESDLVAGMRAALCAMLRKRGLDFVLVAHMARSSSLYGPCIGRSLGVGLLHLSSAPQLRWFRDFSKDAKSPIAQLSSKRRSGFKRNLRRIGEQASADVQIRQCDTPDAVGFFVEKASELAAHTWQAGNDVAFKDSPAWRESLAAAADRGALRCHLLMAGDKAIAYEVGSVYSNGYNLEVIGYDTDYAEHSPGKTLLAYTLDGLYEDGVRLADFGGGHVDYKLYWSNGHDDERMSRSYAVSPGALLAFVCDAVSLGASGLLGVVASRLGVRCRLKRLWVQRLKRRAERAVVGSSASGSA